MALFNRILLFILLCLTSAWAFVPPQQQSTMMQRTSSSIQLTTESATLFDYSTTAASSSSSSELVSVATLDPTTVLSDALGGLLGSSAILAVPIIAALSVVGLIAFFIVSYANPEDEDD
eukprot:CAMPEP_0113426146 /NCGR_PEP_ID=MMETSP0013_2-20120614/30565_1 /TAXON_ID=2843 ORGANISM="Skeletonema costatum, Strain 1716" /NCGR_SAMPLE_ID=MMETSP0013_2 /ASSEMBLY_ACC=CAM_ASM_000158 /LENGTH=118 /DNA_ID=CAMNT_0000314391 /DNA_START=49 /DNA_END=405 /DNA_ORIENTATION=- /assembly_acc=CAM_ASM_000158